MGKQLDTATNVVDLIAKKRDKKELSHEEIKTFVDHTVNGKLQDCQIGAMLMAMMINELTDNETVSLTKCMIESGDVLNWPPEWSSILVDKHSTGGIGDKISLILAPALAACGAKVPMISGRGLDITGGTLDKLESIPGYNVEMNQEVMLKALSDVGCFIAGQTGQLVPADKELYKRRDVTATVPSPGLITGSILSKKSAGGVKTLILDLKVGKAAFFKTLESAKTLAQKILATSKILGLQTRVACTRMDTPIGCYVGNALEVVESVYTLQGKGPDDIDCLVEALGGHLLELSGLAKSFEEGQQKIHKSISDGSALQKFKQMIIYHGVKPETAEDLCKDPLSALPRVPSSQITPLKADKSGIVTDLDALIIGQCSRDLGAGRYSSSQPIDYCVGLVILVKEGKKIEKGNPWLEVHHSTPEIPESIRSRLEKAITIGDNEVHKESIIMQVLQ